MREKTRRSQIDPKIIIDTIHEITIGDHENYPIKVSDLPTDVLPTDTIDIVRLEGYEDRGDWQNGETRIIIERERPETEEEKKEWSDKIKDIKAAGKERRFLEYQRLKKEFEPGITIDTNLDKITSVKLRSGKYEELRDREFVFKEIEYELDCPYQFTSRCTVGRCDCPTKVKQ